ncbi:hypothetical protein C8Q80DRAFT_1276492 [Daedaleopsis nitida]|nr:hypothetical protein C8Q80DRAFT_1276492 [Daedaleopsis nitida]
MALALNYDILAEIVPYLSAGDALALGATSSLLHQLAIRHALFDVQLASPTQLIEFCEFVLHDSSRLPYLRKLTLLNDINAQPGILASMGPLTHLLFRANDLLSLTLPQGLDYLFIENPDLSQAISKLPSIMSLSLSSFGDQVQAMLLTLRSAPTLRHLAIAAESWFHLRHRSSDPLVLPLMPNLQTLVLVRVPYRRSQGSLPAATPALRSLQVTHIPYDRGDEPEFPQGSGWASLEHIRGDVHSLMQLRTLRPLHALEVDVTLSQVFHAVGHSMELLDVIKASPPQRLSITMQASYNRLLCHWPSAPASPPMRYLELFVVDTNPASHDLDPKRWLRHLSDPGPKSLVALAVYIQLPPLCPRARARPPSADTVERNFATQILSGISRSLPHLRLLAFRFGTEGPSDPSDPYAIFSGTQFSWWFMEEPQTSSTGSAGIAGRVDDSDMIELERGEEECDSGHEGWRWRRLSEPTGARLFTALREAGFEKMADMAAVDAYLAAYL